jgi:hypothetical protein
VNITSEENKVWKGNKPILSYCPHLMRYSLRDATLLESTKRRLVKTKYCSISSFENMASKGEVEGERQ